jgi:hypothetical protein
VTRSNPGGKSSTMPLRLTEPRSKTIYISVFIRVHPWLKLFLGQMMRGFEAIPD